MPASQGQKPPVELNVPRRMQIKDPEIIRWGTVTTVKAPLPQIARFVAYHLDLGASQVHLFLDDPNPDIADFFAPLPQVIVTQCDDDHWTQAPDNARLKHQSRQTYNSSLCYRNSDLHWLAHVDIDEFLLPKFPMADLLAKAPDDAPYLRFLPAELLAGPSPEQFKLAPKFVGHDRAVLHDIYPNFGAFIPAGFISHRAGKIIARTGFKHIRLGIHALFQKGHRASKGHTLSGSWIGHAHAPSWEVFEQHLAYRLAKGSYRNKTRKAFAIENVLTMLITKEGKPGLKRFYDEVCVASPTLLTQLAAHDMLVTAPLNLDEKCLKWFGTTP